MADKMNTRTEPTGHPTIDAAIEMIVNYGGFDGAHHKDWVLDQTLRILMGPELYASLAASLESAGCPLEEGIAP